MIKFIILTNKDSGKKVYVNPSAIQLISEKQNSAVVSFYGSQYSYIEVSESPESIMNLIQNTEENRRAHETNASVKQIVHGKNGTNMKSAKENEKMISDGMVRGMKEYFKEYEGCRNCKHQPQPMQMCKWGKKRKRVELICSGWEKKDG